MDVIAAIGYKWLIDRYSLDVCDLLSEAFVWEKSLTRMERQGEVTRTYYPLGRITIEETWQSHLSFAVRREGINVEVLRSFFGKAGSREMAGFVRMHPLGAVRRKMWFLYEFLMRERLDIPDVDKGGYVPLVDESLQYALPANTMTRSRRHRILNNLIGNRAFSPFIRKVAGAGVDETERLKNEADGILRNYSPELLYRAVQYLYVKETKSSFAIEHETPDQRRLATFIDLVSSMAASPLVKETLVAVQNGAVDPRYRQNDWRTDQVYVGETLAPDIERVHFVAPKPEDIGNIMDGFLDCLRTWTTADGADPLVMAAAMGFAFVFLHPFDDGNGRVHRFLLHAILSQAGFVPKGLLFPVSAVMLKDRQSYDQALESFSRRLMRRVRYQMDEKGEISVKGESTDYFRAIDYTPIVEYFRNVVAKTIRTEWKAELDYLKRYDRAREQMRSIVDMPEKSANKFVLFALQNGGHLSKAKRIRFPELTDDEVSRLESVIADCLGE